MATYNGEKYLREQLDSIIRQSYTDWRLIIADDCSSDGTINILEEYKRRFPSKISYHINDYPSGSAKNNFYGLLNYFENEYFMFADQDDVWLEDKIFVSVKKIKSMEKKYGNEIPLLVHTDLKVVDKKLNEINPSLFVMQKMDPERDKINNILVTNVVTGCTIIGNNKLYSLIKHRLPNKSIMHDMWLALVATSLGKIGFINQSTILYRQHDNNTEGAKDLSSIGYIVSKLTNIKNVHDNLLKHYQQSGEFLKLYSEFLNENDRNMLKDYSEFKNKNFYEKFIVLKRYDLFKTAYIQRLAQIFI